MTAIIKSAEDFQSVYGLAVGGSLDLSDTGITALPDGLTVGGSLYLRGTGITALPDGLTVGGSLYLSDTGITTLPDGLAVGGSLDLTPYSVRLGGDCLRIGCQRHALPEWSAFSDREIAAMDGKEALKFWRTWKEPLLKWAAQSK